MEDIVLVTRGGSDQDSFGSVYIKLLFSLAI